MKTAQQIFAIINDNIDNLMHIWEDGYKHGSDDEFEKLKKDFEVVSERQRNVTEEEQKIYNKGFEEGYDMCLKENDFSNPCSFCNYDYNIAEAKDDFTRKIYELIKEGFTPCTFCRYYHKDVDEYPCTSCVNNYVDKFEVNVDIDLNKYIDGDDENDGEE